jgi:UPF0271 protein
MSTAAAKTVISLNTDIGEGFGAWRIADDDALLALVTDANLACGSHASDPDIMRRTCEVADREGITVGAQVGYFDPRGFGRRFIEVEPASLTNDVLYQLGALSAFAAAVGNSIGFLKIHGALYHAAVARPDYAAAIIESVKLFDPGLPFLCQPGTALFDAVSTAGLRPIREGYVDRAYQPNGLLVPRGIEGSVITDVARCAERAVRLASKGEVETVDGAVIEMPVDSICIHSDSPGAVEIAQAVRAALEEAGLELRPLS